MQVNARIASYVEWTLVYVFHIIAFFFDIFTYLPFYFIQEPKRALELSARQKAVNLTRHPAGPYRCAEEGEICTTPDEECSTLDELFSKAVSEHAHSACLGTRVVLGDVSSSDSSSRAVSLGEYKWLTYSQVADAVTNFAKGLISEGVKAKHNVLLFAETRAEWMIAAQACFRENITLVTLYTAIGSDAIAHVIRNTGVTHVITSQRLLEKLYAALKPNTSVKTIVYMTNKERSMEKPDDIGVNLISFEEILENGRRHTGDSQPQSIPKPTDLAVVMFTSGSCDTPKGVMLSHGNLVAACAGLTVRICISGGIYLAYLPLSHVLELVAEISCLYLGLAIGYGSMSTLTTGRDGLASKCKGDIQILEPSVLVGVPSIFSSMHRRILRDMRQACLLKRTFFEFALEYKRKWLQRGANTPFINRTIMKHLKLGLGTNNLCCVLSGGAPLHPDTQEFLRLVLCCPVLQGYGLTETGGAGCVSDVDDLTSGHVGAPLPCNYIKLVDWEDGGYAMEDPNCTCGEIWIGGPTVALGYYNNEDKTEESFHPRGYMRWFATGDIGKVREDGTVVILQRKNDIAKLQTGQFVSAEKVEMVLKACPSVENIFVVVRPDEQVVVAIAIPDVNQLQRIAEKRGNTRGTDERSLGDMEGIVLEEIHELGIAKGLQKFELPQRIALVTDKWTPDNGLLSGSMKLRRNSLSLYYDGMIEELYKSARASYW